jgi:hypothetical protein
MRSAFRDMNPTVRGFLIIALIALVIVVLRLETTLTALFLLGREEISMWSTRSRLVFYGAAALMVVNVAVRFFTPIGNGWNLIVFLAVFVGGGFAMWRVWRDEHTYSY